MGTNYYVAKNKCDCCKRYDTEYHIGKSSWGWSFTFQGYKWDNLTSWKLWKEYLKDKMIVDEYGEFMSYDDFVNMIETVKSPEYIRQDGHKNLSHNSGNWFNPEHDWNIPIVHDWNDDDGYSFTDREFS
jgi:hypothetical protein